MSFYSKFSEPRWYWTLILLLNYFNIKYFKTIQDRMIDVYHVSGSNCGEANFPKVYQNVCFLHFWHKFQSNRLLVFIDCVIRNIYVKYFLQGGHTQTGKSTMPTFSLVHLYKFSKKINRCIACIIIFIIKFLKLFLKSFPLID